jgi:hypothetical protein
VGRRVNEHSIALAREWRRLGRMATAVAVLTSPALFILLYDRAGWPVFWAIAGTILGVAAFRGLVDVLAHKLIPAPSLYGAEQELRAEDVVSGDGCGTGAASTAGCCGSPRCSRCSSR